MGRAEKLLVISYFYLNAWMKFLRILWNVFGN